jgi:hypothetical protein
VEDEAGGAVLGEGEAGGDEEEDENLGETSSPATSRTGRLLVYRVVDGSAL